jgi:Cu/Ag efflux pump CusA
MTTLAMGAGMLPIAVGLGADGGFRAPLGVSVIGGLITSTLLSLVVVPAAYSVVGDLTDRFNARFRRRGGGTLTAGPAADTTASQA